MRRGRKGKRNSNIHNLDKDKYTILLIYCSLCIFSYHMIGSNASQAEKQEKILEAISTSAFCLIAQFMIFLHDFISSATPEAPRMHELKERGIFSHSNLNQEKEKIEELLDKAYKYIIRLDHAYSEEGKAENCKGLYKLACKNYRNLHLVWEEVKKCKTASTFNTEKNKFYKQLKKFEEAKNNFEESFSAKATPVPS